MRIRSTEHRASAPEPILANENDPPRPSADLLPPPDAARISRFAQAAYDPDDPMARVARSLRLSIAAAPRDGLAPIRSVAVLGLGTPFAASVVAANLAIAYAQAATPTVLVDAHLAAPVQHELLGVGQSAGLAAVLAGEAEARGLVERTAVRGLAVLAAGRAGPDATVLLDGERFHRRAMPLLDSHGMMVVDVGTVDGGTIGGDPPLLCGAVDAAIIVVRRHATPVQSIRHVADRLADMRTLVVGTLVAV